MASLESGSSSRWSRPKKSLPALFSVAKESKEMGELRLRNRSLYDTSMGSYDLDKMTLDKEMSFGDSGIDSSFLSSTNSDCFTSPPRKAVSEPLFQSSPSSLTLLLSSLSLDEVERRWRRRRVALFDSHTVNFSMLNSLVALVIITSAIFALLLLVNKINYDTNELNGKYAAMQFAFDKRTSQDNLVKFNQEKLNAINEDNEVLNGKRASIKFAHVKRRSVKEEVDGVRRGVPVRVGEGRVDPEETRFDRRGKLGATPVLRPPRPLESDETLKKEREKAVDSSENEAMVKKVKEDEVSKVASTKESLKKASPDKFKALTSQSHIRKIRSPQSKPFRLDDSSQADSQNLEDESQKSFRIN